mmetsp:Transcript_2818/g.7448  ORF Transcript_2818/g.7448 Transcript_2818/m.7448 type:complete len:431 (+) Transcript_2818:198-1490(+)
MATSMSAHQGCPRRVARQLQPSPSVTYRRRAPSCLHAPASSVPSHIGNRAGSRGGAPSAGLTASAAPISNRRQASARPVCTAHTRCVVSAGASELSDVGPLERHLGELCAAASQLFPLWVVLAAALGLWRPGLLLWFTGDWIVWGLALTMIGMGTSLEAEDFTRLMQTPLYIACGVLLQYTVMPGLGAVIAHFCGLPKAFAVGLVLVACCPGGTASNIVTFLAKADVALSVGMTTVSTLLAAFTTPFLTQLAVGTLVPVNVAALFKSTCQVVLAPVMVGAALNRFFPGPVARSRPFSPIIAILTVALICGSVVAQQADVIRSSGLQLLGCVFMLHAGGFALGYIIPKIFNMPEKASRTVSIEVGMQNSSLGSMLAALHFAALPGAAAPGAISACMHSVLGSCLAALWRWQDSRRGSKDREIAGSTATCDA